MRTEDRGQEAGWIDVTVPIRDGMVHWPGDPEVRVTRVLDLDHGDEATVSRLDVGAHTGTHVDAPVHFVAHGAGIDAVPTSSLMGPARVVDVPEVAAIGAREVDAAGVQPGERILFRTRNSERCWTSDRFVPDYTYVALDGARRLVEKSVRTVGVDYLSVGGGHDGPATHRELLLAGICVIEGLNLSAAPAGPCELICLPLRIQGGDGAPARVLVRPRT
jgi:arylformamidase